MQITIAASNDQIVTVEVDNEATVATLKAILEVETHVSVQEQTIVLGTKLLQDGLTLLSAGVNDGDVLQMIISSGPVQRRPQQAGPPPTSVNPDGSLVSPLAFMAAIKSDAAAMANLRAANPQFAAALDSEDVATVQEIMRVVHKQRLESEAALARERELLEADPFNPETQRRIEDLIHSKNIEENYMHALEHAPEVFTRVEMLYVNMEVNGVPVKAFIDSGAQMSIMTQEMAERCNIGRLVDKRFQGVAVGVGQSKIVGRVHQAPLKVANQFITSSVTILEQRSGPKFIFGLDNLRRHLCSIDLRKNALVFGSCDAEIPFLAQTEIPEEMGEKEMQEASKPDSAHGDTSTTGQPPAADGAPGKPSQSQGAGSAAVASSSTASDGKISQLMALGHSKEQAVNALHAAGGNVEAAAAVLTFGADAVL